MRCNTMTNKITEREILNAIVDGTVDADVLVAYAEKRIGILDKRTASAKVRAAKKRAEGDVVTEQIFNVLSDEPMNRNDIVAALEAAGVEGMTPNKVTARMNSLVKAGRANKEKVRAKGEDGKTKESTVYTIA